MFLEAKIPKNLAPLKALMSGVLRGTRSALNRDQLEIEFPDGSESSYGFSREEH